CPRRSLERRASRVHGCHQRATGMLPLLLVPAEDHLRTCPKLPDRGVSSLARKDRNMPVHKPPAASLLYPASSANLDIFHTRGAGLASFRLFGSVPGSGGIAVLRSSRGCNSEGHLCRIAAPT